VVEIPSKVCSHPATIQCSSHPHQVFYEVAAPLAQPFDFGYSQSHLRAVYDKDDGEIQNSPYSMGYAMSFMAHIDL
jgi:hypothetical protein